MSIKPEDYEIDSNYRHWEGDKAEDYIGPFFFVMDGENTRTAFRVQEHHCNAHDSLHGGVLMALADYTLCICANGGETASVVTVSCNSEFIASGRQCIWCATSIPGELARTRCRYCREL